MSNVTLFTGGNNKVSLNKKQAAAAAIRKSSSGSTGGDDLPEGGVYINFSGKMGRYSIGEEKNDADPNELWLLNVWSLQSGWICWKGGSPAAKRMASIYEEPIQTPSDDEHGPFSDSKDGWFAAKAMMFRSLDSGTEGLFSTNTVSALREIGRLEGEIARRMEEGEPYWPIIQLGKEEFTARGNKNWKPKFTVYGWLGDKQIQKMVQIGDVKAISEELDDLLEEAEKDVLEGTTDDFEVPDAEDDIPVAEDMEAETVQETVKEKKKKKKAKGDGRKRARVNRAAV